MKPWVTTTLILMGVTIGFGPPAEAQWFQAGAGIALDPAGGRMYLIGTGGTDLLARTNLDGTGGIELLRDVCPFHVSPTGALALNLAGGSIFMGDAQVTRTHLDGTGLQIIVPSVAGRDIRTLVLHAGEQRIYWSDYQGGLIQRANLDGSNVETVISGLPNIQGLALHEQAGKVYWTQSYEPSRIARADLDGSNIETLFDGGTDQFEPLNVALDVPRKTMFWRHYDVPGQAFYIYRADLDGHDSEPIFLQPNGFFNTSGFTVDPTDGRLYWMNIQSGVHRIKPFGEAYDFISISQAPLADSLHVHCIPLGGTGIAPGQVIEVECFATALEDTYIRRVGLDFPCVLSGLPGASGTLTALNLQVNQAGSTGGTPWLFSGESGVISVNNFPICFSIVGDVTLNCTSGLLLAQGQTRYLATLTYQASTDLAGQFPMYLENYSEPPADSDVSRFNNQFQRPVPFSLAVPTLRVPAGTCCDELTCLDDTLSRNDCLVKHPGAVFFSDRFCGDPEPCRCSSTAECAADPCDGIRECDIASGACVTIVPGSQCDDVQLCTQDFCDQDHPLRNPTTGCVNQRNTQLFWLDGCLNRIHTTDLINLAPQSIGDSVRISLGIAIDSEAEKVYWSQYTDGYPILEIPWAIKRSGLDGLNQEMLVTGVGGELAGIAVDRVDGKLYWANQSLNTINCANLDGSNVEVFLDPVDVVAHPTAIAIDQVGRKFYWLNSCCDNYDIRRCDLDGTNNESIVSPGNFYQWRSGLAVDSEGAKLYWSDPAMGLIRRANLDGTNIETLYTRTGGGSFPGPLPALTIDHVNRKLYFAEAISIPTSYRIRLAELNGSNLVDLGMTGLCHLFGLATNTECCQLYGDIFPTGLYPGDGIIDVDDVLCGLAGFANLTDCPGSDVFPCGGDGLMDVDDLTGILNAFTGNYACPHPCP